MTTLGLKNVNLLSKERFNTVAEPGSAELWAISGSGFGFPSNNYEDLELGASGTIYTAPANGYVYIVKASTAASQYVNIYNGSGVSYKGYSTTSGQEVLALASVLKGKNFKVEYSLAGTTKTFCFIYAEGE